MDSVARLFTVTGPDSQEDLSEFGLTSGSVHGGFVHHLPSGPWVMQVGYKSEGESLFVEAGGVVRMADGVVERINDMARIMESLLLLSRHRTYEVAALDPILALRRTEHWATGDWDGLKIELPPMRVSVRASSPFEVTPELLNALDDRLDGVVLLADALRSDAPVRMYSGLLRFFERAFGRAAGKFDQQLRHVLGGSPHDFDKSEIAVWMQGRPRVFHADRIERPFYLDGDVVVECERMREAAFWVLFNKKEWNTPDEDARKAWSPGAGTSDLDYSIFVAKGQGLDQRMSFFDPWGAFPMNMKGSLRVPQPVAWAVRSQTPGEWVLKDGSSSTTAGSGTVLEGPVELEAAEQDR